MAIALPLTCTKALCISGAAFPQVESLMAFLASQGVSHDKWGSEPRAKKVDHLFKEMQDGETVLEYLEATQPRTQEVVSFDAGATSLDISSELNALANVLAATPNVSDTILRVVHVARVKVHRAEDVPAVQCGERGGGDLAEAESVRQTTTMPLDSRWLVEVSQKFPDGRVRQRGTLLSEKIMTGQQETWQSAAVRGILEELGDAVPHSGLIRLLENTYYKEEKVENSHSYPGMMSKYVLHSVDALVEGLPTHKFTTLERDSCGDVRLESTWDWFSAAPENNAQTAGDAPSSLK